MWSGNQQSVSRSVIVSMLSWIECSVELIEDLGKAEIPAMSEPAILLNSQFKWDTKLEKCCQENGDVWDKPLPLHNLTKGERMTPDRSHKWGGQLRNWDLHLNTKRYDQHRRAAGSMKKREFRKKLQAYKWRGLRDSQRVWLADCPRRASELNETGVCIHSHEQTAGPSRAANRLGVSRWSSILDNIYTPSPNAISISQFLKNLHGK